MKNAAVLKDVDERGQRHHAIVGGLAVTDIRFEFECCRIKLLHQAVFLIDVSPCEEKHSTDSRDDGSEVASFSKEEPSER